MEVKKMEIGNGIIISILRKKGYGYIQRPNGEAIFFHADGVCNPSFEDLREGYNVEFMIRETPKGNKAIGVVAI